MFQMFEKLETETENKEFMIKNICSPPQLEKLRYNGRQSSSQMENFCI